LGISGTEQTKQKNCRKLAQWQYEVAALKEHRISFVFYSVIFIHKLDIIKKEYIFHCQFS